MNVNQQESTIKNQNLDTFFFGIVVFSTKFLQLVGHCNLFFSHILHIHEYFSCDFRSEFVSLYEIYDLFLQQIIVKLERYTGAYTEKLELLQKGWLQGGFLVEKCSRDATENLFTKLLNNTWPVVLVVS